MGCCCPVESKFNVLHRYESLIPDSFNESNEVQNRTLLNKRIIKPSSTPNAIHVYHKKLHDNKHGGYSFFCYKTRESDIDFFEMRPYDIGFTQWYRKNQVRGTAEWVVCQHELCDEVSYANRILFLHGGGYSKYSPKEYRPLTSRIAKQTNMPVLVIDYRLAPEFTCPAPLEDALLALRWIADNDPNGISTASNIYLMGDSAGGGLVLSVLLNLTNEDKRLPISGAVTFSAWTDLTSSLPSYHSRRWDGNGNGDPLLSSGDTAADITANHIFSKKIAGEFELKDPRISPYWASHRQLEKIQCPILMMVGDEEVMLDDTIYMAKKIVATGGIVEVEVWEKMWHVWILYAEVDGTEQPMIEANRALEHVANWLHSNHSMITSYTHDSKS